MEKYSAFRDPGTGIQPFLTPVPPIGSDILAKIALPFAYIIGPLRTVLILALGLAYVALVRGVCLALIPVPPLYRLVTGLLTSIISRLILLLVGVWWIPVELVTRKRGRTTKGIESWDPRAGDIIVSNWVSWIEILWLSFRLNPMFVLPVCEAVEIPVQSPRTSTPIAHTPGRRTGTGSAALSSPNRTPSTRKSVTGFHAVSLLSILSATGRVPPYNPNMSPCTLEEIRQAADRPIVIFPECTTSNGRGMLRFADVFRDYSVPVKRFKVFIMCVRCDPPTNLSPTLSHSIPSLSLNPIPHLLKLTTALRPQPISIRLLSPSESPSSQLFMVSEVVLNPDGQDVLSEACAALIAQIGKVKRTGMGWEDKVAFLNFYRSKK